MTGQTLSHYRILSPLGRGAMGEVFLAEDIRLGRRVAIKVLPLEVCCVPAAMDRFQREARIISSLNHPNICTLFDIGEHDGRQFMVMELLEGATLGARLAHGPLALDDALAFAADAAAALEVAHRQGVVHRDIKPANLFVTAASVLKVLDFGVAKLADAGGSAEASTSAGTSQLTMSGTAVGTVTYMSPEQARGEPIDGRSDLFSLGVVLYEMVAGRPPFTGATQAGIFEGILTKAPERPSARRPDLPEALDAIVLRALEKDPARRYQSAAAMRADLLALRRATDPQHAAAPAGPVRRSRAWWLAAPVATAAIVTGVVAWQAAGTPALESRDLVVLSDLTNRTGDVMFDDTLGEALAVQLRQSPFLNLVSDQRIQATLRMMERTPGTRIDPGVGREVCQRVGAKALLTSTIASLGSSYVLTLGALDCVTGDTLAERQTQVARKEDVLRQLGEAARELREQLGESLASLTRYDASIEQATTGSLEALKAYSQAVAARRTLGDRAALPLFRRAVELDPAFALAHARLGTAYSNLNDFEQARRHTARAYELRPRVSELERLYIEARYFTQVEADLARAVEAYRVTIATYPNDFASRVNLAILLRGQGSLEQAVSLLREAVQLAPEEPTARVNLASTLLTAGQIDEARTEAGHAIRLRDDGTSRGLLTTSAVLGGDEVLEREQLEWATAQADRREALPVLLPVALYRGHLREAERLSVEAERVFGAADLWPLVAEVRASVAVALAMAGATDRASGYVERLEHDHPQEASTDERMVLAALVGDDALARRTRSQALAASAGHPGASGAATLQALADIAAGDYERALASLGPVRYQVTEPERVLTRGYLLVELGRFDEAVGDFEWLLANGRKELTTDAALARFKKARALDGAGRSAEARAAYAAFLEFWKTADQDLPIVQEARRALDRLGS